MADKPNCFLIEKQCVREFYELLYGTVCAAVLKAHEYIGKHPKVINYSHYPVLEKYFFEDFPDSEAYRAKIPVAKYGICKYSMEKPAIDRYDYSRIFYSIYDTYASSAADTDAIRLDKLAEFQNLKEYVDAHDEVAEIIVHADEEKDLKTELLRIVLSVSLRYLFQIKASSDVIENHEEELGNLVAEKVFYLFEKKLNVTCCVPISLVSFPDDRIELSDYARIIRIPEDIQKSRQAECCYENTHEAWVAAAATHMIELDVYYENSKDLKPSYSIKIPESYPIEIIENIIGIIRIATGYTVGYKQVLGKPVQWFDTFNDDLAIIYGVKVPNMNPTVYKNSWMQLEMMEITPDQIKKIQELYPILERFHQKAGDKKGTEVGAAKRLLFAMKRFNRCKLRNEKDDMATDATIGLEALLLGGEKGEITYKLSSRIPVVFQFIKNENFTPSNSRRLMGKIYNYRSSVVHGSELKERDRIEVINGKEFEIPDLAVEFLRYTLQFMLEHPEYLDAKKFDEYIDQAVEKMP